MNYIKCDSCQVYDSCKYLMKDSVNANNCDEYEEEKENNTQNEICSNCKRKNEGCKKHKLATEKIYSCEYYITDTSGETVYIT